jgi:hypothetical protein
MSWQQYPHPADGQEITVAGCLARQPVKRKFQLVKSGARPCGWAPLFLHFAEVVHYAIFEDQVFALKIFRSKLVIIFFPCIFAGFPW